MVKSEDLVSHGMPNIFSNSNHMTKSLTRFRGEVGIINLVVNLFPKMKAEEGTNVHSGAISMLEWDSSTVGVVQEEADIK